MSKGGMRPGAGRPKGTIKPDKKIMFTTRMPADIIRWLRKNDKPMSKLIEEALRGWFKI